MIGWIQQRAYLKSLRAEAREVKFQAVRFRPEAENMLRSILQLPRIKDAEVVELPNGQFQVVAQEEGLQHEQGRLAAGDRVQFPSPIVSGRVLKAVVVEPGGMFTQVRDDQGEVFAVRTSTLSAEA